MMMTFMKDKKENRKKSKKENLFSKPHQLVMIITGIGHHSRHRHREEEEEKHIISVS